MPDDRRFVEQLGEGLYLIPRIRAVGRERNYDACVLMVTAKRSHDAHADLHLRLILSRDEIGECLVQRNWEYQVSVKHDPSEVKKFKS